MKNLIALLLLAIVCACGSQNSPDPLQYEPGQPIPLPEERLDSAKLYIFTAPWCHPCSELHKALGPALEAEPELKEKVAVTAWVGSTSNPSTPSNEASCAEYKLKLGVFYEFLPDPWRYKTYAKYFGSVGPIPAAAALDDKGELLQKFKPGTFSAEDLIRYFKAILQQP